MLMTKENVKKIVKYWQTTAEHDYETMLGLFNIKRYSDSLFYGHIILEKILKGMVAQKTKKSAPYIHNLTMLSELAECALTEEEEALLDATNKYNIRCRYPEFKLRFYKLCDLKYTKEKLDEIKKIYKKLCKQLEIKIKLEK
ncbi:MAG: HEPN domain-containing protein [Patescibacteria group bacterium]